MRKAQLIKFFIWFFTSATISFGAFGQDSHLSQFFASPLYENPALCGNFMGDVRITGNMRSQWASVTVPYVTTALTYEQIAYPNSFGFHIMNSRAGNGRFNVLTFNANFTNQFDLNRHNVLFLGIQGGFIQKGFDYLRLTWNNQYEKGSGGRINRGSGSGELFTRTSIFLPDISIGALWQHKDLSNRINPSVGLAVFHINKPKESFLNISNKLPRKFHVHGGMDINLNRLMTINGSMIYMQQGNFSEFVFLFYNMYYLRDAKAFILSGVSFRTTANKDAGIVHLGLKRKKFTYRLSYDVNVSSLNTFSKGRGAFEFSIQYIKSSIPRNFHKCPRL
ncbi:MAG: PorP/SprF family type IX secretion system membrane protein [Bacteroidia bacterium]|nr:PorP/SprF family type IX secretion system membrane protein [Bacteroidia bacterium]